MVLVSLGCGFGLEEESMCFGLGWRLIIKVTGLVCFNLCGKFFLKLEGKIVFLYFLLSLTDDIKAEGLE